jgi:hypothetical protein
MKMRLLGALALMFSLLASLTGISQNKPNDVLVSLIELISNPEKFDGKVVTVQGFLVLDRRRHDLLAHYLYLHREDADNLLTWNALVVVPSKQMLRDEEEIDRMYVRLTGTYRAERALGSLHAGTIKDIVSCTMWSDPSRPVGLNPGPGSPRPK